MKDFLQKHLGTFISVLIALVGLYFGYRQISPDKPELTIEIRSILTPTSMPNVKELSGTFEYKGKRVERLTVATITISNSGTQPIVGTGSRQNLVSNRLYLPILGPAKVLDVEIGANQIQGNVEVEPVRGIGVRFEQWRPRELIELTTYIEGDVSQEVVSAADIERQVIEGVVRLKTAKDNVVERGLGKYLNGQLIAGIRGFAPIAMMIISFFGILAVFAILKEGIAGMKSLNDPTAVPWINLVKEKTGIEDPKEIYELAESPRKFLARLLGIEKVPKFNSPLESDLVIPLVIFSLALLISLVWALDTLLSK